MSQTKVVKITKMDMMPDTSPPPPPKPVGATRSAKRDHSKKPKFGVLKRGKTARSKPRFEAVRDPTSAPPVRKSLRILTHKAEKTRRAKISEDAKKMPIHKIRDTLRKNKLPVSSKREDIVRKIYEDAQEAGMLSLS
jgi:hypothetical protein